jgi:hypothetical protein
LVWAFFFFKEILAPLWPFTTVVFASIFTVVSFRSRWSNAILAIAGIALYATGWFIASTYGPFLASFVSCIGILMWFTGAIRSTIGSFRQNINSAAERTQKCQ